MHLLKSGRSVVECVVFINTKEKVSFESTSSQLVVYLLVRSRLNFDVVFRPYFDFLSVLVDVETVADLRVS